jgi:hypothetical protein
MASSAAAAGGGGGRDEDGAAAAQGEPGFASLGACVFGFGGF